MGRTVLHPTCQQEAEQVQTRPVNGKWTFSYPQYLPHQQYQTLRRKQFDELPRLSQGTTW